MDTVAKLDAALEAAFLSMGIDPDEAKFRLRDIIVEEVSLVDRAANRRRFLVVKNAGGKPMSGTAKNAADDQQGQGGTPESNPNGEQSGGAAGASAEETQKIALPKPVKEGLMRVLTEGLERLVSLSNMVKEADETDEEMEEPVPAETGKELMMISDLLRGALSKYPSPMSKSVNKMDAPPREVAREILWAVHRQIDEGALDDPEMKTVAESLLNMLKEHVMPRGEATGSAKAEGEVSKALAEIAEMAAELSKVAASEDELGADLISKIRKLAAALNGVAEKYPEPTAGATEDRATTDKNEEGEMGAANAEPAAMSKLGTEVSDKLTVIADAIARVAESPSPDDLAEIASQLRGVAKAIGEPGTEDQPAGDGAEGNAGDGTNTDGASGDAQAAESQKGEGGDAPAAEPTLAELVKTLGALVSKLEKQETEKRAAENHLQPPDRVDGDMGNIGQGPKDDKANVNAEGNPLSDVMKRLDTLGDQVKKLSETPQVPASRGEQGPRNGAGSNSSTKRPGGRWAM